jgi:hypothetical protein
MWHRKSREIFFALNASWLQRASRPEHFKGLVRSALASSDSANGHKKTSK